MSTENAIKELVKIVPPGWKDAKCCGTCDCWNAQFDQRLGSCGRYLNHYFLGDLQITPKLPDGGDYHGKLTRICDNWEKREDGD